VSGDIVLQQLPSNKAWIGVFFLTLSNISVVPVIDRELKDRFLYHNKYLTIKSLISDRSFVKKLIFALFYVSLMISKA